MAVQGVARHRRIRLKWQSQRAEKLFMGGIRGAWLCPTEHDRARAVEAGPRVRKARTVAAVACAVALTAAAPWMGWWMLLLLAIVAVNLATLELRLARAERPEWVAARSMLLVLGVLAVGVALSGGQDSPMLAWLIFPIATAVIRFRSQVVIAGAVLTAAVMVGVSVAVDPAGVAGDPSRLLMAVTLLVGVTAIAGALMQGELEHRDRAVLDPLTGLLNRASLGSRVAEIEQQARLTGAPVSLVLLDLDRFKRVNDEHGHERGDAVLRATAYEIRKSLRSFELVYRIGGEEFLVLLPGIGLAPGVEIAERVRRAVALARPGELELTVSAGVACGSGARVDYDVVFRAADEALLRAKRAGRNRVVAADGIDPAPLRDARGFELDTSASPIEPASA
jgi:diguanylate cyclase (GGDEF)-like protein